MDHNELIDLLEIKYLLVKIIKVTNNTSIFPVVSCIEIDSSNVYVYDGKKYYLTDKFKDFIIGIVLDDNIFLKNDTGLLLSKKNCNNLSSDIIYKKKIFNSNIEFISKFSIIMINNYEIIPFYLPTDIIKIDYFKKYIDLSISQYYSLFK